ncbi:MAG: hypothetical protein WA906_00510 [Pacificimonas sp.]
MVRQIPGFIIDQADSRRGFGQGGANVIFNGRRLSGKSNDAVDALSRISAEDVVRFDIVEGTSLDIPGLSGQVLDVISRRDGISGQFSYGIRGRTDNVPWQFADFNVSVSCGDNRLGWTLALENDHFRGGDEGLERVISADGTVIEHRNERQIYKGDNPELSGALRFNGNDGSVLNLNGQIGGDFFRTREIGDRSGFGLAANERIFRRSEDEFAYEVGGDYEFDVREGRLKLIGLRSFEDSPTLTTVNTTFFDGSAEDGIRFDRDADEAETIARAEYSWKAGPADWQVNLEGALNSLTIDSALEERDDAGEFQPVPLPGATASVEEKRAELGLSYGRPLSSVLALQASVGGEYSEISQSGPLGQTRSFVRPKGFVSLAWRPGDGFDIAAKVERAVGQLDFFDFIATVNINDDLIDVTNADLVPAQSWESELEITKELGPWGSLTARGYYQAITDIVDQVPIGLTGEAPGNLDNAEVYGIEWNSTILGEPVGWDGARLDVELQFQRSRLDDPLTGIARSISFRLKREIDIEFRHDVPGTDWAYGSEFDEFQGADQVRLDSTFREERTGFLSVFAEHKDVMGLVVRGSVGNLLDDNAEVTRQFFAGRRTDGLAITEDRLRTFGTTFRLSVEGSF